MRASVASLAAALLCAAGVARGDSSIRCPGGLVGLGAATIELLGKCGEPTLREGTGELTTVFRQTAGGARVRATAAAIERWTYDFGPQRFIVVVTLTGGRITAIANGSWGYAQVEPAAVSIPRARCDASVLRAGLTKLDVLARCGEPALAERQDDLLRDVLDDQPGMTVTRSTVVTVEVWTYDFGPQSFVRFVTLEDGVVKSVDTGGKGFAR